MTGIRRPFGRTRQRGVLGSAQGMTLLEVLIAIMLFAVFTGVTVMVTELMAAMLSSDQKGGAARECGSPPLDRACIDLFFDELVETLQEPTFSVVDLRKAVRQCGPSAAQLLNLSFVQIPVAPWPSDYEICLYDYGSVNSAFLEDLTAGRPGLYLLQAQPLAPSPMKRPVQRLFCRPRTLCG
jgi:prepilin-type N-terminal cleavage/methylation domain-containing protein